MSGRALSAVEQALLQALERPGIGPADRTVMALALQSGAGYRDVSRALHDLARGDPPLVSSSSDADLGLEVWFAVDRAD